MNTLYKMSLICFAGLFLLNIHSDIIYVCKKEQKNMPKGMHFVELKQTIFRDKTNIISWAYRFKYPPVDAISFYAGEQNGYRLSYKEAKHFFNLLEAAFFSGTLPEIKESDHFIYTTKQID
ncbi:MAG: hypothetical protein P4L22_05665 [Candidatus Babeliales bacterium]|nr:hypothetical protein [Candidatus Babeliales bacterium]